MWRGGVFIGLTLVVAGTTPVTAQSPRIGVDPRVELMAILFKLAGNPEFNHNGLQPYNAEIERHFGPYRDHDAVTLARALHDKHDVGYSVVMGIAIRLTDPPELRERVPFDTTSDWPAPPDEIRRFVEAARRFARDSRAEDFFRAHRLLYDSATARLRRPVERGGDLAWLPTFFGVDADRAVTVVALLASSEGSYGPCVRPRGKRLECYSVIGHHDTDAAGLPLYDDGAAATLIHEAAHGYANPLGNAHRAEFARSAPRVYALVADAMTLQSYPWPSMVNESLVRATEARYHLAHGEQESVRAAFRKQNAAGWYWLEELSNLFREYEADRRTYPTLASFMPRVIAYFDSLADRVPAMQRRYDATRPRIASLSVQNGSEAVDPGLREIVVQFDRTVRNDGWGILPVLGSEGPAPGAVEHLPKITWISLDSTRGSYAIGQALDASGTTLRLGIELEPGRDYEIQLNTPHGYGFRSTADDVPIAPYRIRFKTRGASHDREEE